MLLDDHEQQLSANAFQRIPIGRSRGLIRKEESSEIIANMTHTLHVNTPEQTMNGIDSDDENDKDNGDKQQQLIEQLQAQLIHNQLQRTQARNYTRILNQSNTPACWYQSSPRNRSVYFYDPNYQRYVQQQITSPPKIKPNIHLISPQPRRTQERRINNSNTVHNNPISFTPRTKYMLDLYTTAVNYHQRKQLSNQNYRTLSPNIPRAHPSTPYHLQPMPTLPPINPSQQRNEDEYKIFNSNEINDASFLTESGKRTNHIVLPPTS